MWICEKKKTTATMWIHWSIESGVTLSLPHLSVPLSIVLKLSVAPFCPTIYRHPQYLSPVWKQTRGRDYQTNVKLLIRCHTSRFFSDLFKNLFRKNLQAERGICTQPCMFYKYLCFAKSSVIITDYFQAILFSFFLFFFSFIILYM